MNFVDSIVIRVRSGDGGSGLVSFKSARNLPRLGADGGDGGFGGDVTLVGTTRLNTLSSFRFQKLYEAESGDKGGHNNKTGKNGEDLLIQVPLGTIAINDLTGECLGEVTYEGHQLLIAKGGKRGLGNLRFLSATHQAPQESTSGGEAVEVQLRLDLKLIADVGLVGFPNAGKSTLLSRISAARPKVADYPFTTLVPNLGVVDLGQGRDFYGESFVVADIPGLIEGASEGRGLGLEFLRHIERTKFLLFLLDSSDPGEMSPIDALQKLRHELASYSPTLPLKKSIAVISKSDLIPSGTDLTPMIKPLQDEGLEVLIISAVTGDGIDALKRRLYDLIQEVRKDADAAPVGSQFGPGFFRAPISIPGVVELS